MKIAPEIYESMKSDIASVVDHIGRARFACPGLTLSPMWDALIIVAHNRAFDDKHPAYVDGRVRVLPHDGRDFCFYYANGCNDSHVATALRSIKRELGLDKLTAVSIPSPKSNETNN